MKKLGQKGFTLVEGLLIVIALSLVVGIGYYVYDSNKKADANLKVSTVTPDRNKSTASKTSTEMKYLEVKELGVKLTLSEDIKDITYFEVESGRVGIESASLGSLLKDCVDDGQPPKSNKAGIITVVKGNGQFKNQNVEYVTLLKQFDDFYLEGSSALTQCQSSNEEAQEQYDTAADKYYTKTKEAFKSAEKL